MNRLPTPSRRVLAELTAIYVPELAAADHSATQVQRHLVELTALLVALDALLADIDRIETALITRFGHPRAALPIQFGAQPTYAADVSMIRRLGTSPRARRHAAVLRGRQHRFIHAADAAGLPAARKREHDLRPRSTLRAQPC